MKITYVGPEMAEKLNRALSRTRLVATGSDSSKWPTCKECGKQVRGVFQDTGLCYGCDEKAKGKWLITVGGGYGSFEFEGTEEEAEAMRRHKARSEGAVATKKRIEGESHD